MQREDFLFLTVISSDGPKDAKRPAGFGGFVVVVDELR